MPNQRMKIGRNATFGEGKASATTGSNSQYRNRLCAIAMPSGTPMAVARQSPTAARDRLTTRSSGSEPSAQTAHHSEITFVNGGRNKGGARPARATASQSTMTVSTEIIERTWRPRWLAVFAAVAVIFRHSCRSLRRFMPAKALCRQHQQKTVCEEGDDDDAGDRGEHVIVGAILAIHEDQLADAVGGGDHFGGNCEHKGKSERDAQPSENIGQRVRQI